MIKYNELSSKKKLKIYSISTLARVLQVSQNELIKLSLNSSNLYTSKIIVKSGKERLIDAPKYKLKIVQQRINSRLLQKISILNSVHGWVRKKSRFTALEKHTNKTEVYTFDIYEFYPSIHYAKIYKLFSQVLGCSPDVSSVLTNLTTYKYNLPQGSPCSPTLANLVLRNFDFDINNLARKKGNNYDRCGDDFIVSGKNLGDIEFIVKETLKQSRLKLNSKTQRNLSTKNGVVKLLGLNIGQEVKMPKSGIKKIKSILHNAKKTGLNNQNINLHPNFRKSIEGQIGQIKFLKKDLGDELLTKLKSIED